MPAGLTQKKHYTFNEQCSWRSQNAFSHLLQFSACNNRFPRAHGSV